MPAPIALIRCWKGSGEPFALLPEHRGPGETVMIFQGVGIAPGDLGHALQESNPASVEEAALMRLHLKRARHFLGPVQIVTRRTLPQLEALRDAAPRLTWR